MNGFCDLVIMGSNFPKRNGRFLEFAETVKTNMLAREPFTSRSAEIRWHFINSNTDLKLSYGGYIGSEALSLTQTTIDKIKRALKNTPMNSLLVLDWQQGGGGANGQIAAVGLGQASAAGECAFADRAFDGLCPHEWGHSMGLPDDFVNLNQVMWYATNGGCEIAGKPYTVAHQAILSAFIDNAKTTVSPP